MARNMSKYRTEIAELKMLDAQISEINKSVYQMKKQRDILDATLMKAMGKSTEGNIDGETVIRIKTSERNSVTMASVLEHAPKLADKIIQKKTSKKIEVL